MLQQVESRGPLGGIFREQLANQVFKRLREVLGHHQVLLSRVDLYLELALPVEWECSIVDKGKEYDTKGPNVRWPRIIAALLYDMALRCSETGRPLAIEQLVTLFKFASWASEIG